MTIKMLSQHNLNGGLQWEELPCESSAYVFVQKYDWKQDQMERAFYKVICVPKPPHKVTGY